MPSHLYTLTDDQFIIDNYATLGATGCAKQMGRTRASVYYRRRVLNLPVLDQALRNRLVGAAVAGTDISTERPILVDTFAHVTTPEAAYILGLLWADGYVHPEKVVLTCLRVDALDYMVTFATTGTWRFSDYRPKRYGVPMQPSRTIRTGHTALATYLHTKGYASKSSGSACLILSTIPDHLKHYWFRGLFDGDGYIGYSKSGMSWVKLTSSYDQDWTYMTRLCTSLGIVFKIHRDRYINRHGKVNSRSVFSIHNAIGVRSFCDYIYQGRKNDEIGLTRKHAKWLELRAYMKTRPRIGHLFV